MKRRYFLRNVVTIAQPIIYAKTQPRLKYHARTSNFISSKRIFASPHKKYLKVEKKLDQIAVRKRKIKKVLYLDVSVFQREGVGIINYIFNAKLYTKFASVSVCEYTLYSVFLYV